MFKYIHNSYGLINDYELRDAQKYGSWPFGRTYDFDKDHRIWDKHSLGIPMYQVEVEYDGKSDDGLCLSIIGFNELVKYIENNNERL